METFNFPFHVFEQEYPESGGKMSFGGGYEFATKPSAPDQVKYILHFFEGMRYFLNANGTVNRTINPTLNIAVLEDFYKTHRLYEKFIYPHPADGNLVVRFSAPLKFKLKPLGLGTIEGFTVELKLQP